MSTAVPMKCRACGLPIFFNDPYIRAAGFDGGETYHTRCSAQVNLGNAKAFPAPPLTEQDVERILMPIAEMQGQIAALLERMAASLERQADILAKALLK